MLISFVYGLVSPGPTYGDSGLPHAFFAIVDTDVPYYKSALLQIFVNSVFTHSRQNQIDDGTHCRAEELSGYIFVAGEKWKLCVDMRTEEHIQIKIDYPSHNTFQLACVYIYRDYTHIYLYTHMNVCYHVYAAMYFIRYRGCAHDLAKKRSCQVQ